MNMHHLPDVIPPKVHQHDVLGALLFVGQQLPLQRLVLLGGGATTPRTGQRPVGDLALVVHPDDRGGGLI